jgi:hypothetical protein
MYTYSYRYRKILKARKKYTKAYQALQRKKNAARSLSWRKRNPDRIRVNKIVYVEIRSGRLKKQPCFCGNQKVEAHHEDYTRPLKIIWLCKKHHVMADKERRNREKTAKVSQ